MCWKAGKTFIFHWNHYMVGYSILNLCFATLIYCEILMPNTAWKVSCVDSPLCVLSSPRRPLLWLPALSGCGQAGKEQMPLSVWKDYGSFGAEWQTRNGTESAPLKRCAQPAADWCQSFRSLIMRENRNQCRKDQSLCPPVRVFLT